MDKNLQPDQPLETPPMMEKPSEPQGTPLIDLSSNKPTTGLPAKQSGWIRYIIAVIVGIAFLGSIFLGYIFFFKNTDHEGSTSESKLDNTLTENATNTTNTNEPKSELEEVVNEIKDQYDNDSSPPGMTIVVPDNNQPENPTTETAPENTKIPR